MAVHDALTGLPNRRRLREAMATMMTGGGAAALLLIDLDHFKAINDLHGHQLGDQLLQEIAKRLTAVAHRDDVVARLGGDEFAILVDLTQQRPELAPRLARRLVAAMETPVDLGSATVRIGCSVGIALTPQDTTTAEELMRLADIALYKAKNDGRNCFRCFETGMDQQVRERAQMEGALREAIAAGAIEPYFQPLFHLGQDRLVGFELLARWHHPELGQVPPETFIHIAEDTGLIVLLTENLLARACRVARSWPEPLALSVNISPVHLHDRGLPEMIARVLAESGMSPRRLKVEVTESAVIRNLEVAKETMQALRKVGVRLSLDDFGTGYSSLRHLQMLPFDEIKIDASFVRSSEQQVDSRKIVAAIVGLGHSLGLPTVAEGVETADQADMLSAMGCDLVQGWLYGKATAAEDVGRFFAQATPDDASASPAPRAETGLAARG